MTCVDHVVDSLEIGGAERLVVALARRQHRASARVPVHALCALGPLAARVRGEGLEIVDHHTSSGLLRASRKLLAARRRSRPDVVHCHDVAATIAGAPPAVLARVPVAIATRHGWGRTEGAWRRELKFWVAARVVAVCEAARRALIAGPLAGGKRTVTILNGAETQQRRRTAAAAARDRCVIVCVARLNWAKNHETFLQALALARVQHPELVLHLVGDGERQCAREALSAALGIRQAVAFLGEGEDIGDCLSDGHARRGWMAMSFFSHKVLRWTCPFRIIALYLASVALWAHSLYRLALLFQTAIHVTAPVLIRSTPGAGCPARCVWGSCSTA